MDGAAPRRGLRAARSRRCAANDCMLPETLAFSGCSQQCQSHTHTLTLHESIGLPSLFLFPSPFSLSLARRSQARPRKEPAAGNRVNNCPAIGELAASLPPPTTDRTLAGLREDVVGSLCARRARDRQSRVRNRASLFFPHTPTDPHTHTHTHTHNTHNQPPPPTPAHTHTPPTPPFLVRDQSVANRARRQRC